MQKGPIFLIGARACGKSTVGKALAKRLGWSFVDTDILVEQTHTQSIADMVQEHGWDVFRKHESKALQESIKDKRVISTGGGMVLAEQNRDLMRKNGLVFFLSVPALQLVERLYNSDDHNRPALTAQGTIQEVEVILEQRLPLYNNTAHYEVDGLLTIPQIVDKIYSLLCKA